MLRFRSFKMLCITLIMLVSFNSYAKESIGLVLSGGGAKGIAHVGVIKALEDADIPIDYVTGTSMGAIVGALYSCGWSPAQMMELFTSKDFTYWSTGTINPEYTYYYNSPEPTPKMLEVFMNLSDSTSFSSNVLDGSLISPLPMNIEFVRLFSPYTLQCKGNFNNLFVPFRCVCSDVYHKHKIVCKSGSLEESVRASMSFPMVFKPIEMDGVLVYDGGIYDNFPVDVMHNDFDPDFIIGVSVSAPDGKPIPGNMFEQLEDMIIQNNDYTVPENEGVKIQVPVLNFGVLDFGQAKEIYDIGYRTGLSMVDSIKERITARRPLADVTRRREAFRGATPSLEFDSVSVEGAQTQGQAKYIKYLFEGPENHRRLPINIDRTEDAYYRAIGQGDFSDLLPKMVPANDYSSESLLLKASVRSHWSAGVGGWLTSSVNSMLYLTLGYNTLSFNSLNTALKAWIGQSYYAGELDVKFQLRTTIPSCLQFQGVLSRQKYYDSELLFYQDRTPSFISDLENYLRVNYMRAFGKKGRGYAGIGYAYSRDTYFPAGTVDYAGREKDKSTYSMGAVRVGYQYNTLNNQLYPSAGAELEGRVIGVMEKSSYLPAGDDKLKETYPTHYKLMAELLWKHYFPVHKNFSVGGMFNAVGTFGPLYQNYTATMVKAPTFAPTPSTQNVFNPRFRADSYLAAGLIPIWMPFNNFQLRGDFYLFMPIRNIVEGPGGVAMHKGWFDHTNFLGELAAVYNFKFASLSLYGNYLSYPKKNWNFGVSFGLLFTAPRFLR